MENFNAFLALIEVTFNDLTNDGVYTEGTVAYEILNEFKQHLIVNAQNEVYTRMADSARIIKVCKEPGCRKPFSISGGEVRWLEEHNLKPFERCSACRNKRKQRAKYKAVAADIEEAIKNGQ